MDNQNRESDRVRVPVDTESVSLESNENNEEVFEYEIYSSTDEESQHFWRHTKFDSSSDPSDMPHTNMLDVIASCSMDNQENDILLADESDEISEIDDDKIAFLEFRTLSECRECRTWSYKNPLVFYCNKCYQLRKSFFPPRPRRRQHKKKSMNNSEPELATGTQQSLETQNNTSVLNQLEASISDLKLNNLPKEGEQEGSTKDTAQLDAVSSLCIMCISNPKNGIFVHRNIGHICCCYHCAVKVWKTLHRCPICNCKSNTVLKVFV